MQTSYEGLWFKEIKQILIEIFDSMSLSFLVVLTLFYNNHKISMKSRLFLKFSKFFASNILNLFLPLLWSLENSEESVYDGNVFYEV